MGVVEIRGQPLTSVFSIADHCFISSEIGGIFGRSRMVRAFYRFRFAFFAFIRASGGHEGALPAQKSSEAPLFNNDSACRTIFSRRLAALGRSCSSPVASPTTVKYLSKSCFARASAYARARLPRRRAP